MAPAADNRTRRDLIVLVLLVVLMAAAFGVRTYYVLRAPQFPVITDGAGYDGAARRLAETGTYAWPRGYFVNGGLPDDAYRRFLSAPSDAWTSPGYPIFLAALYKVFGAGPGRIALARVVNALLSALTIGLAFLIARRLSNTAGGLLAAVLVAIYPSYTFATGFTWTETFFTFMMAATVLGMLVALERRTVASFAVAGALLAASAYVRPIVLLWPVFLVAYMLFKKGYPKRDVLVHIGVFAATVLLLFAPWWIRNWNLYHRFIPLTTSSANTLAAGTSDSFEAGGRPTVSYPANMDQLQLNDYWYAEGKAALLERLRTRPGEFFAFRARAVLGTIRFWWPPSPVTETRRPWLHTFQTDYHPLLWWLMLAGALVALAFRDGRALLVASLPLYFIVMHAVTLPLARYLHPMMLFGGVLGAYAIVTLFDRGRALPASPTAERRAATEEPGDASESAT